MDSPSRKPIVLDADRYPWDQQPRESSRQYQRFLHYRDLGRMRSLTAVNKLLTGLGDKLTYGTIRIQSHLYRWAERAQAYDRHQDDLDRERVVQARRDMIDRHQRVASALLTKALTALRTTEPEDLDPADIVRWVKLATDIEIRALGEPSHTIAVTGPAGGPIQTEDLTGLSAEDRQARLRELATELAHRAGLSTTVNEEE
jgi:hypothetical protein